MSGGGGPGGTDDDALLAELGEAVRAGAEVPARFLAAGRAAFVWRTVDAELARLVAEPAGMRGATRHLSFRAGGRAGAVGVELEVGPDGLRGQLDPPGPGSVRVQVRGGEPGAPVAADEIGWFVARPVPAGELRVHVRAGGAAFVTEWFTP
ncbi:hypothetical protein [Pseudonocardia sp.]|uniref:hypothetical protein n=1 Tax=Pseudonocardia sp. TaxID=60912 RepID=UPI003D1535A9